MSQVQQLYQLQQIDTEYREKKQRLGDVLRAQKETAELLAARQQLETAVTTWKKWHTRRRDLGQELDSLNDKTKRSEARLYSGNVKNPKELTDLQHEIEALARRRAALEDDILETMLLLEEAETGKAAAEATLKTIETRWQQSQTGLKQEQNELALRLHDLTEQRKRQVTLIARPHLTEYETLSQKKGGVAVAALKLNLCQSCRLTVSAQIVKEAQEGQLVRCGSCGRILYPLYP